MMMTLKENITWILFLMTSQLDSHTTTDVKQEMLSGVQTGNGIPRDSYNISSIAYTRTNRKTTFSCKED